MAKPIKATPTLKDKDAERLSRQAEQRTRISAAKRDELNSYAALYRELRSRSSE